MRLINADTLEKTLRNWVRDHWEEAFIGADAGSEFADMIDRAETIDSAPLPYKAEVLACGEGDLISRQAALSAMDTWDKFGCNPDGKLVSYDDDNHYVPYVHYDDMIHVIKHLPSAQPEPYKAESEDNE